MAPENKVFVARLAGLPVLGPDGESIGRVRDAVVAIRATRTPPRVLGLAVELSTRRRIFVPMLRVTAVDPHAVTLNTGSVSLRPLHLRAGEAFALAQLVGTRVRVRDPELPALAGQTVAVVDVRMEQGRTRDWTIGTVAVRAARVGLRRGDIVLVEWSLVDGLAAGQIAGAATTVASLLDQLEGLRPADVAHTLHDLPARGRAELVAALSDEKLADVIQELPVDEQRQLITTLDRRRAGHILDAMDADDVADLLGALGAAQAESLLATMDPQESEPVRRLLIHSPDTAGGLMTPEPLIVDARTTVAEALARARHPDLTPAIASMAFVVRPPTATPTGTYLGCVHLQALLREPPATLASGIIDANLPTLAPDDPLEEVTRYFARYNLVCGPVIDTSGHLLGAVTVDDVLDHLLPRDWREIEFHSDDREDA